MVLIDDCTIMRKAILAKLKLIHRSEDINCLQVKGLDRIISGLEGRNQTTKLFLLYALFQFRIEDRILYRIPNLLNFLNRVLFLPRFLRVLIEPKYKFG